MNAPIFLAKRLNNDKANAGKISRLGTVIATVSVAISIFVMILSLAIVRGFRSEIERKAVGFSGQIRMEAPSMGFVNQPIPIPAHLSYLPQMAALPQVNYLQEFAMANGVIRTEEALHGVALKGVGASFHWDFFQSSLLEGSLPNVSDSLPGKQMLVSKRMSKLLSIHTGDELTLFFIGTSVRLRKFTVCGIYDAQLEDIDNHLVLCDIRQVQNVNGWTEDQISGIELYMRSDRQLEAQREELIAFAASHMTDEDEGVAFRNVRVLYSHLFDWLDLLDLNVWILLVLMVVVAGFNMISSLLIMLFEKTAMVGLLKSLGMRDVPIKQLFLYRSAVLVLKGALYGTVLAVTFCVFQARTHFIALDPESYFVASVPIDLTWWQVAAVDVIGCAAVLLLLLFPLRGIVRISPDQSIRMK